MSDLVCQGIVKHRGRRAVLSNVDVEVPAGRSTVLLGQSGAGKTTLLRIIAGLDEADAGSVTLGGRVLSDPRTRVAPESRSIGVVFQALELWSHMTVAEHIAFGLPGRPRGRRALALTRVQDVAEQVGLPPALLARRPDTLSGGEQQRVAIARTLAPEPAVILYDEPLANLDPDRRRALRALIRRLAARHGTTLVYVTHDAEEALEIGDEVVVLAEGRVVERGVPSEVYAHPTSVAGARALGPVNVLAAVAEAGHVATPLGTFACDAVRGPCRVLWRPESIDIATEGGVEATVTEVVARAGGWRFQASVGDVTVEGYAADAPVAGSSIGLSIGVPAAVLTAQPSSQEVLA